MRVLSGRLKAVLVASLATIILIGILAPATMLAADPPGLGRVMAAIARVESGGDYTARNPTSGAYGKYQILPSNWPAWARLYLGDANARPTPANQEILTAAKFRALHRWLGTWRRVAYWWLTGSDRTSGWSYAATRYVTRVMAFYQAARDTEAARDAAARDTTAAEAARNPTAAGAAETRVRRFSERSGAIVYSGTWRSATSSRYVGRAVKYSIKAGATATFTFTGTKVEWRGPVGPTRGRARVRVDGQFVKTVNAYASSFVARRSLFSQSWATPGPHTLVIEVVGTAGHPYVAIDELVVTD